MRRPSTLVTWVAVAIILLMTSVASRAEETLAAARELYVAAAYEEALAMLDRLLASSRPRDERRSIALHRVLCLAALGRTADTQAAIEAMITDDPSHRPVMDDLPPRIRTAITETRVRLLPQLVQEMYARAKTAFDRQDFETAAEGFERTLETLEDPDVAAAAKVSPLADLRTLAIGFHDLSTTKRSPAPAAAASTSSAAPHPAAPAANTPSPARTITPPVAETPAQAPAAAADNEEPDTPPSPPKPDPNRLYYAGDSGVFPPFAIRQTVPAYPGRVTALIRGVVEVVIDRTGRVETATMREPLPIRYERLVLEAAREWRYVPARIGDEPVRFRKLIEITVDPER